MSKVRNPLLWVVDSDHYNIQVLNTDGEPILTVRKEYVTKRFRKELEKLCEDYTMESRKRFEDGLKRAKKNVESWPSTTAPSYHKKIKKSG